MEEIVAEVRRLVTKVDEVLKAASNRTDPSVAWEHARALLADAGVLVERLDGHPEHEDLVVLLGRRTDDIAVLTRDAERASLRGPDEPRSIVLPQPEPVTLDAPARRGEEDRLPPGQRRVRGLPVLHVGRVPDRSRDELRLLVTGKVEGRRHELDWAALTALPEVTITTDVHCVTAWSRYDVSWTGVRVRDLLDELGVLPTATHALIYGANAYSANLDLRTLRRDDVLLAWACDGEPLTPEHGAPLRLVVPSRYFWKSTKWVETIQLLDRDVPGYWEARGYHNVADPFLEQRYA